MSDAIHRPPHYNHGDIEPIDVIEDWKLSYHLGNVVKYIARAGHKGDELADLKKARWYLDRAIEKGEPQNNLGGCTSRYKGGTSRTIIQPGDCSTYRFPNKQEPPLFERCNYYCHSCQVFYNL